MAKKTKDITDAVILSETKAADKKPKKKKKKKTSKKAKKEKPFVMDISPIQNKINADFLSSLSKKTETVQEVKPTPSISELAPKESLMGLPSKNELIEKIQKAIEEESPNFKTDLINKSLRKQYIKLAVYASVIVGAVIYNRKSKGSNTTVSAIVDGFVIGACFELFGCLVMIYSLLQMKKALQPDSDWKIETMRISRVDEDGKSESLEIKNVI